MSIRIFGLAAKLTAKNANIAINTVETTEKMRFIPGMVLGDHESNILSTIGGLGRGALLSNTASDYYHIMDCHR